MYWEVLVVEIDLSCVYKKEKTFFILLENGRAFVTFNSRGTRIFAFKMMLKIYLKNSIGIIIVHCSLIARYIFVFVFKIIKF